MALKVFAHRGFSAAYPENTLLSFEKAIEAGADAIECDVQISRDGEIVIFHDEKLDRTTGTTGLVKDWTWKELSNLDAGSYKGSNFAGEKIPRLSDLLHLVKEKDIFLNIELKNGIIPYPNLGEKAANLVKEYGLIENVIISSFNHPSLFALKNKFPEIKTGILFLSRLHKPWEYAKKVKADALHPFWMGVEPDQVQKAKEKGFLIYPFTVNEEWGMKKLIEAGVNGIITDHPDKLFNLKKRLT